MRRTSVSMASNIAEGRGRITPGEFRQFLGIAQGSTYELQTQLLVARKLGMVDKEALEEAELLSNEVSKMLGSFIQTLGSTLKSNKKQAANSSGQIARS
jgi:four helix bundle protein